MKRPRVIDQYLLRRADDSLELWLTDELGVSWCEGVWPFGASVGHQFDQAGASTIVGGQGWAPTVIAGHAPEVHESGGCDCQHGCRFGR